MTVACALTLLLVAAAMVVVRIEGFALKAASAHQMRSTLQMNMFERMAKVVSSNVNSVIRNLEDPEKVAIHSLQHAQCLPDPSSFPSLPFNNRTQWNQFLSCYSLLTFPATPTPTTSNINIILCTANIPFAPQHHPLHHQHHSFAPPTSLLCTTNITLCTTNIIPLHHQHRIAAAHFVTTATTTTTTTTDT
jgi:hypothetical protein